MGIGPLVPLNFNTLSGTAAMESDLKRRRTSEDSDGPVMRKPRKRGSVAGEVSASLSSVISRLLSEQPEIELSSIYVDAVIGEQAIARNISFSDMDDEVVSISSEVSTSSMWC